MQIMPKPKAPVFNNHGYTSQQIIERVHATVMTTLNLRHMAATVQTGDTQIVASDESFISTAATDGWNVVYNDEFVQRTATTKVGTLDIKPMVFVTLHEALHKGLRHVTTCDDLFKRNPILANAAADYVVNGILMDLINKFEDVAKVMAPPLKDDGSYGMLYDPQYLGMDVRQVFAALEEENNKEPDSDPGEDEPQPGDEGDDGDSGSDGDEGDSDSNSGSDGDEGDDATGTGDGQGKTGQGKQPQPRTKLEKRLAEDTLDHHDREGAKQRSDKEQTEVDRRIQQAQRMGGMIAGRTGGNVIQAFDSKEPEIDWREVFEEFVREHCRGDDEMTTARFDRRLLHLGIYNPTSYSTEIGRVGVFIDTSGSTTGPLLDMFMGNLSSILTEVNPGGALVAYWDDGIQSVEEYMQGEYDRVIESTKPVGGGGTSPACIPPFLATGGDGKYDTDFDCIVILTDGEFYAQYAGDWSQVSVPTLWCVIGREAATFVPPNGVKVAVK